MNTKCCNGREALNDPCQAILDGIITSTSFGSFGLNKGQYLLLLAQCGTTSAIVDLTEVAEQILACCEASRLILINIDENTDEIESKLDELIVLVTAGNVDLADILIAVQLILTEAQAINANTDQIEALLLSIITILNAIDNNTDDLEACCAATNILLTQIELNQENANLLGTETLDFGTQATAPAAGPYISWTIVKTNSDGTVRVDGLTLNGIGDATSEKALPQHTLPLPVIVLDGGNLGEYEWKTYE